MHQLLKDLLQYAAIGNNGEPPGEVDLNEVLQSVMDNLQMKIKESGATIEAMELPEVKADRTRMIQLFQNLAANALKFRSDRPPEIVFTCAEQQKGWLFAVKDNGIGIPEEEQEQVFRIFQRTGAGKAYEGTGIGLAICEKIIHQLGGKIWMESVEGHGSVFYFTIPE